MSTPKKYIIIIFTISITIILLGICFYSYSQILRPLEQRIKDNYSQIHTISMIDIGPNCNICYYVEENTSFEVCKDIFYETSCIINEEDMYKRLNDAHKRYANNHEIVFLKIEFTTKESDKPAYGLICEFTLNNPPVISEKYDMEKAVWRCVDANNNFLGEFVGSKLTTSNTYK